MSKFAAVYEKDGNYHVIAGGPTFATADEAVAAADVTLQSGYGLTVSPFRVEELSDAGFPQGPFITAAIAGLTTWIVGGQTLDQLTETRHPGVENLPEADAPSSPSDPTDI